MAKIARFYTIECYYCGVLCDGTATEDHIIPRDLGGEDEGSNKVWSCRLCNWAKGNLSLDDFKKITYWETYCAGKTRKGKYEDEFPEYAKKKPPHTMVIADENKFWETRWRKAAKRKPANKKKLRFF